MALFAVAALLLTCGAIIVDGNLLQLAGMIKKVTGKSAIPHYSTYGCYCGLGGKGTPLDKTDWCCHRHDCCFGCLEDQGCNPKVNVYHYTFQKGKVICSGRKWWLWQNVVSANASRCGQEACECDQRFVQCLKRNLRSYHKAYRYHLNFFCSGLPPQCQG